MTLTFFQPKSGFLDLICTDNGSRLFHEKRARNVSSILSNVVYEVKLSISGIVISENYK